MLGIFLSFQVNAGFALIVRVNDSTPQYMWEDVQWTGRTVESMGVLFNICLMQSCSVIKPTSFLFASLTDPPTILFFDSVLTTSLTLLSTWNM
jgi:hypothetical protein